MSASSPLMAAETFPRPQAHSGLHAGKKTSHEQICKNYVPEMLALHCQTDRSRRRISERRQGRAHRTETGVGSLRGLRALLGKRGRGEVPMGEQRS